MAEYMQREGWDSEYLRWYVDYSCRDDFAESLWQGRYTGCWKIIARLADF